LARTHAFSVAGDALFAIGLAGTIFFLSPADAARTQVGSYLLLTIAPFAVVAPLIGPALDRVQGGRRWMMFGTGVCRAVTSFLLVRHLDSLFFYPEAFMMLVFSKGYHISKSAMVPTTVKDDAELVEANSKLALLSGLAVVVAIGPGFLLMWLGDAQWVLGSAIVVFVVMSVMALKLPRTTVARQPADQAEKTELRGAGILLAASAMGLLRGIVGFLSFLLAFELKDGAAWKLGVVAGAAQIGYLIGSFLAPRMRKLAREEHILIGSLVITAVMALGAGITEGLAAAAMLSLTVGTSSSAGKQAFDSIVQRDAPDANRGRTFARFETRFQIVWVIGALLPVMISIPIQAGFFMVSGAAVFATVSYLLGMRGARFDAGARIREWRKKRRTGADDETAERLGFQPGAMFEAPPPPPPAPEVGLTDQRIPPPPLSSGPSPAAQAAERRRQARAAEAEVEKEQAAKDLAEAEANFSEEEAEPDLDWHPNG
jgi:hypothetical protein